MLVPYQHTWQVEGPSGLERTDQSLPSDLQKLSDLDLVELIVARHEKALGAIYDRYSALVYTIALRITGDRQTAEEVMQDVFQAVWQTSVSYRGELASFSTWLSGITRHRAIDAMRSRRERARTREFAIEGALDNQPTPGPDGDIDQLALRDAVRQALNELPSNQRQAVELAYYGGLTRAEIAERLGEPLGTIKTRLRLAMSKLRDMLDTFTE